MAIIEKLVNGSQAETGVDALATLRLDRFLNHTGFISLPGITTSFTWRETDGVNRDHSMHFWIKELG